MQKEKILEYQSSNGTTFTVSQSFLTIQDLIDSLDETAAAELKVYDHMAYDILYFFQHLKECEHSWTDIPGFSDLNINAHIVKNAITKEKGPQVCAHIQSGKLYASPETRTAILMENMLVSKIEQERLDFIRSLYEESMKRKNEADGCQQDSSEED